MATENYNGIRKKKTRRITDLVEIQVEDEWRRAFGVYQLCQCMIEKPQKGKSYHILTGGQVDLISHMMWLQLHWKKMKKVFISAWAISGADILLLEKWAKEGLIDEIEVLVGDIFPSKYVKEWEKLTEMQENGYVKNVYKSTIHSKLLLMEAEDGTHLVIESSANCNMNPRVEQSCVTISDILYDFYWVYLHELFDEEQARYTVKTIMKGKDEEQTDTVNSKGASLFGEDDFC